MFQNNNFWLWFYDLSSGNFSCVIRPDPLRVCACVCVLFEGEHAFPGISLDVVSGSGSPALDSVQGLPENERGATHEELRTLVIDSRLPRIWNSLAGSACLSLILLEYHGGLWLFHFMVLVNVLLVNFPGLTCSAPPSPVLLFHPEPWLLGTPISPTPQAASSAGAKPQPKPTGLGSLVTWPSPFQNVFQHCLAFLAQSKPDRKQEERLFRS